MKRSAKILALLLISAFVLSGCVGENTTDTDSSVVSQTESSTSADESSPSDVESDTSSEESVTSDEESSTENQDSSTDSGSGDITEVSYMEKFKDMIEEMAPKDILIEREGVTYPTFEKYHYYSTTAERDTPVNVLLPADFSEDKEYPVLYILHGYYDNEDWMKRDAVHLDTMLTNLIADGAAEEMIVVLPYIYCSKDMPYCTGMDTQNTLNYDNFINDMMTDLMPYIEENFPIKAGRENTAITGFSMGARESLFIGFSHPETFGYIGGVCAAPGLINGTGYPYQLEKDEFCFTDTTPYLLMLSAADNDGVVGNNPMTYHTLLNANGTEHLWHTMSSTGHDASSVTPHLYNFMRMIFKEV
ncbi:MAG: hypothetical protein J1E39_05375 [Eubacterium sp.]|nr:hypothetical protein [Eubacterium sp.]